MNLSRLQPFIESSLKSRNPMVKSAAEGLSQQMQSAVAAEEINQPTLHKQESNKPLNSIPQDEIDQALDSIMPDIDENQKTDKSQFGKAASAYASDVTVGSLPKGTQDDIFKFTPSAKKTTQVVQYGMVVSELLPKVDQHNYKLAQKHITEKINKIGKRAIGDEFQDKMRDKYILLLNDSIVDGHHFLALADSLGISCSLKVLDLTPVRFQKTAESLLYVLQNHRRQAAA